MTLHRHKVRSKPGWAEALTGAVVLLAAAAMLTGPMALPGNDWRECSGQLTDVYLYQNASTSDGRPFRVRATYSYLVDGKVQTGLWDGDWPEAHSANALPAGELDRLRGPGFPLRVFYDPDNVLHSTLHTPGNQVPAWWLRWAIGLGALVLWYVFVVYPRLKSSR